MMLSEEKTYRTRDGIRTGIRVRPRVCEEGTHPWACDKTKFRYTNEGRLFRYEQSADDLIEEQPAERPFSYHACPMHADGRRRAVTRDGREAVLLCDDAPGAFPYVGWTDRGMLDFWRADGSAQAGRQLDLLIPPPPKRVVWVNLYERKDGLASDVHASEKLADEWGARRLGNRAYPIEIDEALR